jgi:hypothetical protein
LHAGDMSFSVKKTPDGKLLCSSKNAIGTALKSVLTRV